MSKMEIKLSCPVCRGSCNCEKCMLCGEKDDVCKVCFSLNLSTFYSSHQLYMKTTLAYLDMHFI